MVKYLNIVQIIVSVLLIFFILLQNRGAGLSAIFGGEGNIYKTKRGAEKFVFLSTVALSLIFLILAFSNILVSKQ